jgi:hypothetical protein
MLQVFGQAIPRLCCLKHHLAALFVLQVRGLKTRPLGLQPISGKAILDGRLVSHSGTGSVRRVASSVAR